VKVEVLPEEATGGIPGPLQEIPETPPSDQVRAPDGATAPDGPVKVAVKIIFPPRVPSPNPVSETTGSTAAIEIEIGVVANSAV